MAQKTLDVPDVHARFEEKCRQGMPEDVGSDVAVEAGSFGVLAEHGADGLLGEAVAEAVAEEGSRGVVEVFSPGGTVGGECVVHLPVAAEEPLPRSLAQDAELLAAEVDVRDRQVADLGDSRSGPEEDFEDGDVAIRAL
jgi:hypothetical protein